MLDTHLHLFKLHIKIIVVILVELLNMCSRIITKKTVMYVIASYNLVMEDVTFIHILE